MRVLHLLSKGHNGGIEILCKEYAEISCHQNYFAFVWDGGCVCDEMKQAGHPVYSFSAKKYNPLALAIKINKICLQNDIENIVIHHADVFIHFCLLTLGFFKKNLKITMYAHSNATDMIRSSWPILSFLKKRILYGSFIRATNCVAISKSVRDSLVHVFKGRPEKIDVIYNGINIKKFMVVKKSQIQPLKLIFVGRLIEVKGVQNTIKALSLLPKDLSYQFEIVGEGDYMPTLKALVAQYDLEAKIIFSGNQSDIPDRLKRADIFVHIPDWEEGFGITIIEAMATGLVCICNHRGAIPEIITNGMTGLLVPNDDVNSLAQTLTYAIERVSSGSLDELKTNARKRAEDFSMETFANQLDKVVCKL